MNSAIPSFIYLLQLQIGQVSSLRIAANNEKNTSNVRSAAIFVQLHHVDKWPELRTCVENVASAGKARNGQKISVALFVGMDDEHKEISSDVQELRSSSGLAEARVEVVKNVGADIGQFLQQVQLRKPEANYDLLLKVHSKSDPTWRHAQIDGLCGNSSKVEEIFAQFEDQAELGMIGPPTMTWNIHTNPRDAWGGKYRYFLYPGERHIQKYYHDIYPNDVLDKERYRVVAGSAFWSRYGPIVANTELRAASLEWLPTMPTKHKPGAPSTGEEGENLMHSLERVIPTMVKAHYGLEVI